MKDKKRLLILIGVFLLLFTFFGISYAYFTANVSGNGEEFMVYSGTMRLEYNDGRSISLGNAIPGNSVVKEFSVKNIGTVDSSYNVWLTNVLNEFRDTSDLVYTLVCEEAEINISNTEVPTKDEAITNDIVIEPNQVHNYILTIKFLNKDEVQDDNKGVSFSAVIDLNNYNYEKDMAQIRQYLASANEYYENNNNSSLLGTNLINELNLNDTKLSDKLIITQDGNVELAVSKNNRCFRKSALSDDIEAIEEKLCNADIDGFASNNGRLHVSGSKLLNERNEEVVLVGASGGDLIDNDDSRSYEALHTFKNWGANAFRIFVNANKSWDRYSYVGNEEVDKAKVKTFINNIIANDMYAVLNWDPDENGSEIFADEELDLYTEIARTYPNDPHIIYEIWNEPESGNGNTWDDVKNHAATMINAIREISPDAIVFVGTLDNDVTIPLTDPVEYDNIMYTHHMYPSQLSSGYSSTFRMDLYIEALDAGLPIVETEWGPMAGNIEKPLVVEPYATYYYQFLKKNNISNFQFKFETSSDKGSSCYGIVKVGNWRNDLPNSVLKDNGKFMKNTISNNLADVNINLMIYNNGANNSGMYYKSNEYINDIVAIEFKDELNVPSEVVQKWDLSLFSDGSIIGYLTNTEESGKYKLTIAANGIIYAPKNSKRLFAYMTNVKSIEFNNFRTDYVEDMDGMFMSDSSLESLDLRMFDVSKVTTMVNTFQKCYSLSNLNVSTWNTKSLKSLNYTFAWCDSLTNLNINNFDVSNVTDFGGAFYHNVSLEGIDISNWNPNKVNSMSKMFSHCGALKNVDMSKFIINDDTSIENALYGVKKEAVIKVKNDYVKDKLSTTAVNGITFITK